MSAEENKVRFRHLFDEMFNKGNQANFGSIGGMRKHTFTHKGTT